MILLIHVKEHDRKARIDVHVAKWLDEQLGKRWRTRVRIKRGSVCINAFNKHELSLRKIIAKKWVFKPRAARETISIDRDPFNLVLDNIKWVTPKQRADTAIINKRIGPILYMKNRFYWADMTIKGRVKRIGPKRIDDIKPLIDAYVNEFPVDEVLGSGIGSAGKAMQRKG